MGCTYVMIYDLRPKHPVISKYSVWDALPENLNIEVYFKKEGVYDLDTFYKWFRMFKFKPAVDAGPLEIVYHKRHNFIMVTIEPQNIFKIRIPILTAIDLYPPDPEFREGLDSES